MQRESFASSRTGGGGNSLNHLMLKLLRCGSSTNSIAPRKKNGPILNRGGEEKRSQSREVVLGAGVGKQSSERDIAGRESNKGGGNSSIQHHAEIFSAARPPPEKPTTPHPGIGEPSKRGPFYSQRWRGTDPKKGLKPDAGGALSVA